MSDPFSFDDLLEGCDIPAPEPRLTERQRQVLNDVRRRVRASCYTTGRERTLQSLVKKGLIKMRRGSWMVA